MAQNVFTGIRRVLLTPLVLQAVTEPVGTWLQAGEIPMWSWGRQEGSRQRLQGPGLEAQGGHCHLPVCHA